MAPSWFFVSIADKGLSVVVSGLESTVVSGCVSIDSKGVCRLWEAAVVLEVERVGISVGAGCGVAGPVRSGLSGRVG